MIADASNQVGVPESRDSRHACQTSRRRDIRIGIDLEQPRAARLVNPEITPPESFPADYVPRRASDYSELAGEAFRQIGGTIRPCGPIFVASPFPLGGLPKHVAPTPRH